MHPLHRRLHEAYTDLYANFIDPLERYCELVAALKIRTENRKGRRLSTARAIERFEACHGNELWQFDLSPSDLKQVEAPSWVEPGRGAPTLMLYSVVDDRSGVCYQEYRCVYGEDVEAALRFLFNAMAPKPEEGFAFQGIPEAIYLDNGPIAKTTVFGVKPAARQYWSGAWR